MGGLLQRHAFPVSRRRFNGFEGCHRRLTESRFSAGGGYARCFLRIKVNSSGSIRGPCASFRLLRGRLLQKALRPRCARTPCLVAFLFLETWVWVFCVTNSSMTLISPCRSASEFPSRRVCRFAPKLSTFSICRY